MAEEKPFSIDIGRLKTKAKATSQTMVRRTDAAAEELGFIDRGPKQKRGRKPSPRTGQVHAKVLPGVSLEIANEAKRRGVVQGVLIEEAWELYKNKSGI